jgi:hypothetical protein
MHLKHVHAFLRVYKMLKWLTITADAKNVFLLLLNNIVFKIYQSHYLCSGNGTPHTNLLIVEGHFKNLSLINTLPIPITSSNDIPTQTEPSFISAKCLFWIKNVVMYCPQKLVTKNAFSHHHPLQIITPVLFYTIVDTSILPTVFLV